MPEISVIEALPFASVVALFTLQSLLPKRVLAQSGHRRVIHNILLFLANMVLMRLLVPLTIVGVAIYAGENHLGVFNLIALPAWLSIVVCVVILDFAIYWQHVATHKFPILWRMHKVHHADHEMDVTTAVRFHPLELFLSLLYKSAVVLILGASTSAVVIFELLLFIGSAFNHSNLALPAGMDKALRYLIATPDTHRSHHSTLVHEQNTNYGFFLIWWDKLFGSYTVEPTNGHLGMSIGMQDPESRCEGIDQMLMVPFR